jgi:uncharacterized protein
MLALITHVRRRIKDGLASDATGLRAELPSSFDLADFELAETAAPAVEHLWDDACAANEHDFIKALGAVSLQQPECTDIVERMQDTRCLASRPGTVAWQRTFNTMGTGLRVHAVDGSPLVAEADYLKFLADRAQTNSDIEIASDDPWLRKPFGSAIIFEDEEIAAKARPLVASALDIIRCWRPTLFKEMQQISRAIQLVRDPTAHEEKIVSFSDNAVPGALFVSVVQNGQLIDPYDLADSLVHEHRHQKLYLLERLAPMVEPTEMMVSSPWREDPRPPSGLLHAVFVFVELRRLWDHVRSSGPARLRTRAINQLNETDTRLAKGLRTLEGCPLTAEGRALSGVLANATAQALAAA